MVQNNLYPKVVLNALCLEVMQRRSLAQMLPSEQFQGNNGTSVHLTKVREALREERKQENDLKTIR